MIIEPPRRALTRFVDGKADKPTIMQCKTKDAKSFVRAYKEVCERDNRTCHDCKRMYLYTPMLKLWVNDPDKYIYDADNLTTLCSTCALERQRKERQKEMDTQFDGMTKIVRDEVLTREGRTCVYCLADNLYGTRANIVTRVDDPDPTDANDWACACTTCTNKRGGKSHEGFTREKRQEVWDLYVYLDQCIDNM